VDKALEKFLKIWNQGLGMQILAIEFNYHG
jgi:hypothetical protein